MIIVNVFHSIHPTLENSLFLWLFYELLLKISLCLLTWPRALSLWIVFLCTFFKVITLSLLKKPNNSCSFVKISFFSMLNDSFFWQYLFYIEDVNISSSTLNPLAGCDNVLSGPQAICCDLSLLQHPHSQSFPLLFSLLLFGSISWQICMFSMASHSCKSGFTTHVLSELKWYTCRI